MTPRGSLCRWGGLLGVGLLVLGCSTGAGEGWVRSNKLYITGCWNGKFDLQPTFFGTNPYDDDQLIRVQRGDNIEEVSDGLTVLVTGVSKIRQSEIGQGIQVGLPVGVTPPGVPVKYNPNPPPVSLALYLHDTCHQQNGTVYSISGSITFASLFSGNPNESNADNRLTDASFDAVFADPRDLLPSGQSNPAHQSQVQGHFRFYFQRGQPAQPFP